MGENGTTLNLFPLTFMVLNFPAFLPTYIFLSVSLLFFLTPYNPGLYSLVLFFFFQPFSKCLRADNAPYLQ